MKYMLDTNICIEVIRKKNGDVIQKFESHISDSFCISAITYSELLFGCVKSSDYSSCVLVTSNEREFVRVPGLIVQNWVKNK